MPKYTGLIFLLLLNCTLPACGGSGSPASTNQSETSTSLTASSKQGTNASILPILRTGNEEYSASTNYANDFCATGIYPNQWEWNPQLTEPQDAPATSGTPRIDQIRNGVVIASYTSLGGDKGYSKPNSVNGGDSAVGPFRRKPYTQWQNGDIFHVYPAVYSGSDMQIYLGPNVANDADYNAGKLSMPENITIRGISVNGQRPVIMNPPSGASTSNYNQSLIYVDGRFDASGVLVKPAANITIENLDIVDSPTGGYLGKAAIYVNGAHNLTLRKIRISGFKRHNVNGIFATGNNSGTLLLENVELDSNGGSNGPEHNAYINASKTDPDFTFEFRGSWSHDSYYGHALKSRAQRTVVEGSYLSGQRATSSTRTETYLLDVPDGGILVARNNIFVKNYSGNQSNGASLTFGVESANPARAWNLTVEHNTFVALSRYYDDAKHELYPMFIKNSSSDTKIVDSNAFVGYCPTGNPIKDFRGTNFAVLGFNSIDLSFRPRAPQLTGKTGIVGTHGYAHKGINTQRKTKALGARD